jgi:hypothetical protein
MNRREAKRYANRHSAVVLETALGEGWPHNDMCPQLGDEKAERDADLVAECVREIVDSLRRRGGRSALAPAPDGVPWSAPEGS